MTIFSIRSEKISKTFSINNNADSVYLSKKVFHALTDVSFELMPGDVLGIIGDNGAGKSTLLKIISGILKPSSGRLLVNGEISSILEIGTGFHPDLSGYENIRLYGRLNGKSTNEIESSTDEIISFSGIEEFIHTPVKYYSSGMFVRLAFATATFINSDIILLDEVFSVGDLEFRAKCIEKILELVEKQKTIIIVSHELETIKRICSKCMVLEKGTIKDFGPVGKVVQNYVETAIQKISPAITNISTNNVTDINLGNDLITLNSILIANKQSSPNIYMTDDIHIEYTYTKHLSKFGRVSLNIKSEQQAPVMGLSPYRIQYQNHHNEDTNAGTYTASTTIPAGLFNCGIFIIDFVFIDEQEKVLLLLPNVCYFKVKLKLGENDTSLYSGGFPGPLMPVLPWQLTKDSSK